MKPSLAQIIAKPSTLLLLVCFFLSPRVVTATNTAIASSTRPRARVAKMSGEAASSYNDPNAAKQDGYNMQQPAQAHSGQQYDNGKYA